MHGLWLSEGRRLVRTEGWEIRRSFTEGDMFAYTLPPFMHRAFARGLESTQPVPTRCCMHEFVWGPLLCIRDSLRGYISQCRAV